MSSEKSEERTSESVFQHTAEPSDGQGQSCCPTSRTWWKVAIVVVLVVVAVAIVAGKRPGDEATDARPAGGGTAASAARGDAAPAREAEEPEQEAYGPETVLAEVNGRQITLAELEDALEQLPAQVRTAFRRDQVALLEQLIARELLLQQAAPADERGATEARDKQRAAEGVLRREVLEGLEVTDEDVREFYEVHRDEMPAGRSFEELKGSLRAYAMQEKQDEAIESYLAKLREDAVIRRNQDWIDARKARMADNPLDRALATGRPVLADFGRGTCVPCKMMKPILDDLKDEYAGRAEILIIETDEYPGVTQRVGVRAIPTQIFYDSEGNEVERHQGFMPREAIVEQLKQMGVE